MPYRHPESLSVACGIEYSPESTLSAPERSCRDVQVLYNLSHKVRDNLLVKGERMMVKLTLCCVMLAFVLTAAGCASYPVMVTDDGLYLLEPASAPKEKGPKVPEGPLSLDEAVRIALANSPRLRMAQLGVRIGRDRVLGALSNYLPKIQLQSVYHHVDAVAKMDLGFPGFEPIAMSPRDITTVTAKMIVPIYTFGKNEAAYRQALRSAEAAKFDAVRARQNVVAAASQGYFRVLEAFEFRKVAEKSLEQIKAHLRVAQNFFEQGLVTRNDVLAAKVRLLGMEQQLLRAQSNVQIASANLNRILGLPISHMVELSGEFAPVELDLTEEDYTRTALAFRPELGSLGRQRKAAEAALSGAKAARYPSINFAGGWNWTSNKLQKNKDNWTTDLMAEWNIFTGLAATAGIRSCKHAIEQLDEARRELIDGIALEVKTAYLNLLQSRKAIEVAKETVKQAQENLHIFQERYAHGLVSSTDVLDAEAQLARARADLARALYQNNAALVNIENAMGRKVEDVRRMMRVRSPGAKSPGPNEGNAVDEHDK